jgi:hypothetical protein
VEVEPQGVEDVGVDGDGPPPEGLDAAESYSVVALRAEEAI